MKLALCAVALVLSGCSVLFMENLPPDYDPKVNEPRCTESIGFPIWDVAISLADSASILALSRVDAANYPKLDQEKSLLIIAAASEGLAHLISAGTGAGWAKDCGRARRERDAFLKGNQARFVPAGGAGFYCASEVCARELEACEGFRTTAHDGAPCRPAHSAVCFNIDRFRSCRVNMAGCQRQLARAGSAARSTCFEEW